MGVGRTTCTACTALAFTSLLALAGCGGGDDGTTSTVARTAPADQAPVETAASAPAARATGRKACQGMTPLEAARHFAPAARRAGATQRFAKLATEPTPEVESSSGYPRLAAAIYATTTPEKGRAAAAAGCAEVLAADGEGGGVSSERTGQTASPSQGGAQQKGSN